MNEGDLVGYRYRLVRRLAQGGMGEIWSARHELTDRDVAIKFLRESLVKNPEALERFIAEARATGRLQHPSLVAVYDVGRAEDGRPYMVMELLAGRGLEAIVTQDGPMSALEASVYGAQIARALDVAHRAGIVHRDVSPQNVFIARAAGRREPVAKLLDFGVSKLPAIEGRPRTGDGTVMGCPAYMSPEQAGGAEKVDARTDVWSLGAVLYECLAGAPPFRARNYNALLCAIVNRAHRPVAEAAPGVDPELAALVDRCLVKDRTARVGDARKLGLALEKIAVRLSRSDGSIGRPARRSTDTLFTGPVPGFVGARKARKGNTTIERAADAGVARTSRSSARRRLLIASAIAPAAVGAALGLAATQEPSARLERGVGPSSGLVAATESVRSAPLVVPATASVDALVSERARKDAPLRARVAKRAPKAVAEPVDVESLPLWDRPMEPGAPAERGERVATARDAPAREPELPRDNPYE